MITVLRINLPKEKTGETVEKLEALLKQGQENVTLLDFKNIDC